MRVELAGVSPNIEDRRFDDPKLLQLKRKFEAQKQYGREDRAQARHERQDPQESPTRKRMRAELAPLSRALLVRAASKAKAQLRRRMHR